MVDLYEEKHIKRKYYTVYITFSSFEEAKKIGKAIVKNKLGVCAHIFSIDCSIYEWNDKIEEEKEYGMFVKTRYDKIKRLEDFIKENHSYEIPQILFYRIEEANDEYLNFIDNNLKEV